jgi:hypothetical protein
MKQASRIGIASACVAVLVASGGYYAHVAMNAEQGWRWCLEAPEARQHSLLIFPLWTVTSIENDHHYTISKVVKDVPVDGDSVGLRVGATVSVMADFDWNSGAPIARQTYLEVHTLRVWKERLGMLGFVVMAMLLPWCFVLLPGERGWLAERTRWSRWRT